MYALLCFEGCDTVARARENLYGWPRPPEMTDATRQLREIGAQFSNAAKGDV